MANTKGTGTMRKPRPKTFRPKVPWPLKVGLSLTPIALQFGSFVPLFAFSWWLARALSIPWTDAPVRDHPHGFLWIVLFLLAMWVLQLAGVMLGFLLNGWILRHHLGLSWEAIPETGLCARFVARWFGQRLIPGKDATERSPKDNPLYDPQLDYTVS
jgi:hypothetical protein